MVYSRLERIASIFQRVTDAHKSLNLLDSDLPVWYNIYKKFPPKYNPLYNRPYENKPIKQIFYGDDLLRAKFHNHFQVIEINLMNDNKPTSFQQFKKLYNEIAKVEKNFTQDELFAEAVTKFSEQNKRVEKLEVNKSNN